METGSMEAQQSLMPHKHRLLPLADVDSQKIGVLPAAS